MTQREYKACLVEGSSGPQLVFSEASKRSFLGQFFFRHDIMSPATALLDWGVPVQKRPHRRMIAMKEYKAELSQGRDMQ